MDYVIKKITFKQIKNYWIEQNHFNNYPNKIINEKISNLGPYKCKINYPISQAYGLFDNNKLIGVTQIQEWNISTIRWRTNNIMPEYRGNDLAWYLLKNIIKNDWSSFKYLFGWFRHNAFGWAPKHGFRVYDGFWHDIYNDRYIAVIQEITKIIGN